MDKKISELTPATSIDADDVSVLVHNNTDYKFSFATLLSFVSNNLATGAAISFGTTLPQNTSGKNGDVFINTGSNTFAQKISGTWNIVYALSPGSQADGTVLYGLGVPTSSTGNDHDTYINTGTGIFYKKTSGSWNPVFTMLNGPAGARGEKGDKGDTGDTGRTILQGTTNPSNLSDGTNGDFYLNTTAYILFGPKTAGTWGSGTTLIGPQGEKGNIGDTGPQGLKGETGDPGPAGADGPTGPKGDTGDTGPAGANGATGPKGDTGDTGPAGQGVPTGGTTGQVLAKIDSADYNADWITPSGGSGSPGGSDSQIQINNGGAFEGSSNFTLNPSTHQLYLKGPNYTTALIDSPYYTGIGFQSNGTSWAFIGAGSSPTYTGPTDLIISNNGIISIEATNIHFSGALHLPSSGAFGSESTNIAYGTGINFYWVWNYGVNAQMAFSNAGNSMSSCQNPDDFLLTGNRNFGITSGTSESQSNVYAQFNRSTKSLILNGGSEDGFTGDPSALIQLDSTTGGFLPSRMSTVQKLAISTPGEGLIVYDTDLHKLCIYAGTTWETINSI